MKNSLSVKLIVIVGLILLLLIPNIFVNSLISDRESYRDHAISEVSKTWGLNQKVVGPYLSVPYNKAITHDDRNGSYVTFKKEYFHLLPEDLDINTTITPETRKRGIYDVVLYKSDVMLKGSFDFSIIDRLNIDPKQILWDEAQLNIGISDLKGLQNQVKCQFNDSLYTFNSGVTNNDVYESGIHCDMGDFMHDSTANFNCNIVLNGSESFKVYPLGERTQMKVTSTWDSPSFIGSSLPDSSTITKDGFVADWEVLHLNRNYPQVWKSKAYRIYDTAFGVELFQSVDKYTKTYRVGYYAILFITLTFFVFYFVEIMNKISIHPIQYLLVGLSLIIFYTLLLSFSEYIGFDWAYWVAAFMTISLISAYTTSITKSKKIGLLLFSVLGVIYTFIYIIIQLKDLALLVGSLGLFTILGIVMYFSRKIDWYQVKK